MKKLLREFTPSALARNVNRTAASEFEQGVIRIAILAIIITYVSSQCLLYDAIGHYFPVLTTLGIYFFVSLLFLWSFNHWPERSTLRRASTLIMDLAATTICGWFTYQDLVISFIVYMWLSVGYGARYGTSYLVAASALGAFGFFLIVSHHQEFWRDHRSIAVGMVATLIIIPAFVSALIAKSERAKRDAEHFFRARFTNAACYADNTRRRACTRPRTALSGLATHSTCRPTPRRWARQPRS